MDPEGGGPGGQARIPHTWKQCQLEAGTDKGLHFTIPLLKKKFRLRSFMIKMMMIVLHQQKEEPIKENILT